MIKQIYDNRIDEILDNLKNRITKEPFGEDKRLILEEIDKIRDSIKFDKGKER